MQKHSETYSTFFVCTPTMTPPSSSCAIRLRWGLLQPAFVHPALKYTFHFIQSKSGSTANPCCRWRYLYGHGVYWTVTIITYRYDVTCRDFSLFFGSFWLYSLSPEIIIERWVSGICFCIALPHCFCGR